MDSKELIETLEAIKRLPSDLHIFCPREQDETYDQYEEDEGDVEKVQDDGRRKQILRARDRRKKFIQCTQILAFDGEDCVPYQNLVYDLLETNLRRCDVCVRRYYLERIQFVTQLRQDYAEQDIQDFLAILDRRDIARIKEGLNNAVKTLKATPENRRGIGSLDYPDLVSLFESFHCRKFHENDALLNQCFDEPFRLIQTRKPLRLNDILPATTYFLFDASQDRTLWALSAWNRLSRTPTALEWDYAIKETLQHKIHSCSNPASSNKLWSALNVIVAKLDRDFIVHRLFDLNPPFYKLTLDHLAQPTFSVPFIVQTLISVLQKAPDVFWQSMGSISSKQLVESIFGSPNFDKCLESSVRSDSTTSQDVLSWVDPFLRSLKAEERPAACRTVVDQLYRRVRSENLSTAARSRCLASAVAAMLYTITVFSTDRAARQTTSRLVLTDALDLVGGHIEKLLRPDAEMQRDNIRNEVMSIVRNALALECECLKGDFESLTSWRPLPAHGLSSYTPDLWKAVIGSLKDSDADLSRATLIGITPFTGLDEIRSKEKHGQTTQETARFKQAFAQFKTYNEAFGKINVLMSQIFETLSAFKPEHFDALFREQGTSMVLFSALFSGDPLTYQATVDIIKAISGESGTKEALSHLLQSFFSTSLYSIDWVLRRIANMRTFNYVPKMLRLGQDILDLLCESSGIMRSQTLDDRGYSTVQNYWSYQWAALHTCFRQTEQWSLEQSDKLQMVEVCRDTMQYAEKLFQCYHIFLVVLDRAKPNSKTEHPKMLLDTNEASTSMSPPKCLYAMSTWLRLRDQYLADTLVTLVTSMLVRLKEYGVVVAEDSLHYIFAIVMPGFQDPKKKLKTIRTMLSAQQKAELVRALEHYLGRAVIEHPTIKKQAKINNWATSGNKSTSSSVTHELIDLDDYDFDDEDIKDSDLSALTDLHEASQRLKKQTVGQLLSSSSSTKPLPLPSKPRPVSVQEQLARKESASKAFIEKRRAEQAAQKARQKEAALRLRGEVGVGQHTSGAGSGLNGIGVQGKDHAKVKSDLMMSSDSDTDMDSDDDMFGKPIKAQPGGGIVRRGLPVGPVRKVKQVRSQKDIRARLTPDLTDLHKEILGWDFFADTDTPPTSSKTDYTLVTNTFKTAQEYIRTFQPLLVLEGWQSFRGVREDNNFIPFELKVVSSLIVDNFFEVTMVLPLAEGRERHIGSSDCVLLSVGKRPHEDKNEAHCLARCKEVNRKKGEMHVVYRVNAGNNPMRQFLNDRATVYCVQLLSLTPLEREYSALMALEYYDLCDEIIRAKPSPLLDYQDSELVDIRKTYNVNTAQAKAVKSALDNDAFTLVQGPPGSGKTKTICAIVGAILTGSLNKFHASRNHTNGRVTAPPSSKKILVCAPSNAAVDELVMRFKDGIKTIKGDDEKINVVRLGRSDAINANVKDVTLEELVNAKLSMAAPKNAKEDIGAVMMEHKKASDEFRELIQKADQTRSEGKAVSSEDQRLLDNLKRQKAMLGNKIDDLRRDENVASREADINRKRMQQEILDTAHVLCATLSGSGHEIFQSLNVEFETVIIDEAAQSIELSALIPLKYGCSKCILVGDPKQLPPTVLSRQAAKFQYEQSLFARMEGNHKKDIHLLDTQYRMHPEISLFPSKMFYDSRLKDGDGMAKLRARPWHHSDVFAPYRFFDVQGMSKSTTAGHSLVNIAELNVAMQLYERLIADVTQYNFKGKIGIITPYKGQLRELKSRFSSKYGERILSEIEFNTTDAFQGRESEIIIFSCVRASTTGLGFLNDIRRMNVGLTRAKCSLWVLGNSEALTKGEYWRGLVEDAKSRNRYTDGDISKLLRKQLLTADMMKDDVEMGNTDEEPKQQQQQQQQQRQSLPSAKPNVGQIISAVSRGPSAGSTPDSSRGSTPSGARPKQDLSRRPSSAVSSNHPSGRNSPIDPKPMKQELVPSKPRTNTGSAPQKSTADIKPRPKPEPQISKAEVKATKPICVRCGSDSHYAANCDLTSNNDSISDSKSSLLCYRCKKPDHTANFCTEPRCYECGGLGHESRKCTVPSSKRLDQKQRKELEQLDEDWKRKKEAAAKKRAEARTAEHDVRIPTVKVSGSPKRKREDSVTSSSTAASERPAKVPKVEGSIGSGGGNKVNGNGNVNVNGQPRPPTAPRQIRNGSGTGIGNGYGNGNGNVPPRPPSAASNVNGGIRVPGAPTGPRSSGPNGAGGPVPPAQVIRRKKPRTDDLFMKKK